MTAKRFTGEFDKQYSGVYYDGEELTNFEVVDLLNGQHETIQRLKQNIDELLSVNVEKELLEENEHLKKQMQRLYNYFEDWHEDEMGGNQFSEMWDMVKEDKKWER